MSAQNNNPVVLVLSFSDAERLNVFVFERDCAKNLMKKVVDNGTNLELDNLTAGDGNCMVTALIQQCKRDEVRPNLSEEMQKLIEGPITLDMISKFRSAVQQFVIGNETAPAIERISDGLVEGDTWELYWSRMSQNGEWGDAVFLHCTAQLLGADILVISRQFSTQTMPYIVIPGPGSNVVPAGDSLDSSLFLGHTGTTGHPDNHYQSLRRATARDIFPPPVFDLGCAKSPKLSTEEQKKEKDRERLRKVRATRNAKKPQLSEEEKAALKREKDRERKAKSRAAQKSEDPDALKAKENEVRAKSRANQRAANPDVVKENDKKFQANFPGW